MQVTIYVTHTGAQNPAAIQSIDGTITNPFNYLQDAITRAYELAAITKTSDLTILLMTGGIHAMLRRNDQFYTPFRTDTWSQNVKIVIKSDTAGTPVTIYYKMRDTFKFLVGAGLTLQDIIFEAADSVIAPYSSTSPSNDPSGCLR